jgi:iron-sulfur cluster repair protein YtfE (RIC family)
MTQSSTDIAALHARLRTGLPWLRVLSTKVAQVHGAERPELRELDRVVDQLALAVTARLELDDAGSPPAPEDHPELRRLLDASRAAADHYRAPEWACLTYRRLMDELAHFEADLLAAMQMEVR